MILATYQPIKPNPNHKSKMDDFQEVFGYKPIWCVSAETLEEFLWQSYFCAPNYGEELIIFETDQYDTIDKCKWYDAIRLKTNTLDKNWINSDCKFKEYIVKDIKNVIFRMPMDLRDYSVRCDDLEEINPTLKVIFDKAREEQSQMMEVDILGNEVPFNPYREPVLFQNYICFNIEKRVLPIMYSLVVQHDPFDWLRFKGTSNMRSWAHSTYINWCRNDCTEEALSKIVDEFYSFFDKSLEVAHRRIQHQKIGRNEPCPCGSGKKFKKCCGKNSAL